MDASNLNSMIQNYCIQKKVLSEDSLSAYNITWYIGRYYCD